MTAFLSANALVFLISGANTQNAGHVNLIEFILHSNQSVVFFFFLFYKNNNLLPYNTIIHNLVQLAPNYNSFFQPKPTHCLWYLCSCNIIITTILTKSFRYKAKCVSKSLLFATFYFILLLFYCTFNSYRKPGF